MSGGLVGWVSTGIWRGWVGGSWVGVGAMMVGVEGRVEEWMGGGGVLWLDWCGGFGGHGG